MLCTWVVRDGSMKVHRDAASHVHIRSTRVGGWIARLVFGPMATCFLKCCIKDVICWCEGLLDCVAERQVDEDGCARRGWRRAYKAPRSLEHVVTGSCKHRASSNARDVRGGHDAELSMIAVG